MINSLERLAADGLIDEVLGQLKTGKEAEIYLVRHHGGLVAAKIYKERNSRNFKNNAGYKEGRTVRNSRTQRAMDRGSKFGQRAAEEAWKSAEADALFKLHALGVRVPKPVLFYEGVLLMELVLDTEGHPAPRLIEVAWEPDIAVAVYEDLRSQMIRILCADLIHGDLSPYNVLAGAQGPVIIDFPQVVGAAHNRQAEFFFKRDLDGIRKHMATFEPSLLSRASDGSEIWREYARGRLTADFVPTGQDVVRRERPHGGRNQQRDQRRRGEPNKARAENPRRDQPAQRQQGTPNSPRTSRPTNERSKPHHRGPGGKRR